MQQTSQKTLHVEFGKNGKLTSHGGIPILRALWQRLDLEAKLERCFRHLAQTPQFGASKVFLLLVLHLTLGFRALRDIEYYGEDPLIALVLGLPALPNYSLLSRRLADMDARSVDQLRALNRTMTLQSIAAWDRSPRRLTIDFDGTVQSTTGHAEGTAVGFNPKHKGARSYYPLLCVIAQSGTVHDMLHRAGNVHDSNGAADFMYERLTEIQSHFPKAQIESRIDSAFFCDVIFDGLHALGVEFTCSLPFEQFPDFKTDIAERTEWARINDKWSYYEPDWKPKSWKHSYRVIVLRQKKACQRKGPLQLDLFLPVDHEYEYTAIMTNKTQTARATRDFHHGRGNSEKLYGELKQHASFDLIPTRRLHGNQVFAMAGIFAHNLGRELQMQTRSKERSTGAKRPPLWRFFDLGTLRRRFFNRAAILKNPQRKCTVEVSANDQTAHEMKAMLNDLAEAA